MKTKTIFSVNESDIVLLNGKRYRFRGEFKKQMPRLGLVLHREFVEIENPNNIQWFTRDWTVDIDQMDKEK